MRCCGSGALTAFSSSGAALRAIFCCVFGAQLIGFLVKFDLFTLREACDVYFLLCSVFAVRAAQLLVC